MSTDGRCPFPTGRRGLLAGLAAAGGLAATVARADSLSDDRGIAGADGTQDKFAFYGAHQAGVTTAQPSAVLYAAFDVVATDRAGLERLFRTLTARIAFLTQGGNAAQSDPLMPPPDSGLLGPVIAPDNLTVTVAVGSSLFDARFGLASRRPLHLSRMTKFPNDALVADQCHGDLLLSFCANTAETNIHALRDILKTTPGLAAVRWKTDGFLPPNTVKRQGRDTVRNLLGFKDGTANLDPRNESLMRDIVWTRAGNGEPGWVAGGTYQVMRVIRTLVERWDRTPLHEQQDIFGRDKAQGAPLGQTLEHDTPDLVAKTIPADAHIRLANPRTPETEGSRILRRAYNYSRGLTNAGQLDMGLLFGCFQANLSAGFLTVQARLNGEPLEEYIKPVGGGYFFVLPGAADPNDFLGRGLLSA